MTMPTLLPLALGLILFSFIVTSVFIVPFINLLYRLKLTRKKEAPVKGKIPLFDKLHDIKAGTPVGGGILVIISVLVIFTFLFLRTISFWDLVTTKISISLYLSLERKEPVIKQYLTGI